jgi:hypothetical protein
VREGMKVAVVSKIEPDTGPKEIDTFPVETDDLEGFNELMTMDGGPLSYYDIVNLEEFYDSIQMAPSERKHGEGREIRNSKVDSELLAVIAECRGEQDSRGLGHALTSLARLRLFQDRISDARVAAEEALILLRGCNYNDREVRSDIAIVLVVEAEVLLRNDEDIKKVEVLLYEARDIVQSLLETLRPGRTDIIVQETAEWIERLFLQVDGSKNH